MPLVSSIFDSILSRIESMARAQTVLGEPVQVGEKTVIPVVKISVGFGAGGSEAAENDKKSAGGGGGGGGFSIQPVGFIVIEGEKTAFLPVKQKAVGSLVELIPNIMEKLSHLRKRGKSEETEEEGESL